MGHGVGRRDAEAEAVATIELGEITAGPPEAAGPGRAGRTAYPSRLPRTRWPSRRVQTGLLLVLLLATVPGAGPAARPLPEASVPAPSGAITFVAAGRLFVADPVRAGEQEQRLSAYRLPDGARLWQVPMPLYGTLGGWAVSGGTLLLAGEWGAVAWPETLGLDLATGEQRWRRRGHLDGVTEAGLGLLWTVQYGDDGAPEENHSGTLSAVVPETGAQRWSLPLSLDTQRLYQSDRTWAAADERSGLRLGVLIRPPGEIEVRDLTSGRLLRSARLSTSGVELSYWDATLIDDVLVVTHGMTTVDGYGLDDLRRRWTLTRSFDPARPGAIWPCGSMACLDDGSGDLRVVDLETGRTRWSSDRWNPWQGFRDTLVASPRQPGSNTRVADFVALDLATGEVRHPLGRWELVGRTGDRLVGVGPDTGGRMLLAKLDPRAGRAGFLGWLSDVTGGCQYAPGVVFCRREDGTIGLWRLPDAPGR